jgi:hypothetical protein
MGLLSFLDLGGVVSFIATIIFILIIEWRFKIHKAIVDRLKGTKPLATLTILVLGLVWFFSLWLTIRVIGLYAVRFILEDAYVYQTGDIFTMLAFVLTANLCFTLLSAFTMAGSKDFSNSEKKVIKKNRTNPSNQKDRTMVELIEVAIQAVIIGFITFLPRYNDNSLLEKIGGINSYFLVLIIMIIAIVVFVFARGHLVENSSNNT